MSGDQPMDGGMFDDDIGAAFDEAAQYTSNAAPEFDAPQAESDPLVMLGQALATSLIEYRQRRRTLFDWMHPQRLATFAHAAWLPALDERRRAQLAEVYLDCLGVRPAPLLLFGDASAALSQVPVPDCLRLFRLRALIEHVYALRSWIDRPRRQLLGEWLGADLLRVLMTQRGGLGANRPLAADVSADALTWRGFRLFKRECGWSADHPMMLVQFALPDESALAAPLDASDHGTLSATSLKLISQLPEFFPARSC